MVFSILSCLSYQDETKVQPVLVTAPLVGVWQLSLMPASCTRKNFLGTSQAVAGQATFPLVATAAVFLKKSSLYTA